MTPDPLESAAASVIASGDLAAAQRLFEAAAPGGPYNRGLAISPAMTLAEWRAFSGAASPRADHVAVEGARILGGWDHAVAPDGTVLIDTSYLSLPSGLAPYVHLHAPALKRIVHHVPPRAAEIAGDVLRLGAPYFNRPGHWYTDFLPRLRGLALAGPGARVAVPEDIDPKFRDMLGAFGIGARELVFCRRDTVYACGRLHLFRPGPPSPPDPANVAFVRAHLAPKDPRRGVKVFAARASDPQVIENWPELRAVLDTEGFTVADMAALGFAEQAALMAGAEILMGIAGPNLYALYGAPASCAVIAIAPDGAGDPAIAATCARLGMAYGQVAAPAVSPGAKRRRVDIAALTRALSGSGGGVGARLPFA